MNDFTKEDLQNILNGNVELYPHTHIDLRNKIQSMIDSFCEHEWRCWDDVHNTRECMKCGEEKTGEIIDE